MDPVPAMRSLSPSITTATVSLSSFDLQTECPPLSTYWNSPKDAPLNSSLQGIEFWKPTTREPSGIQIVQRTGRSSVFTVLHVTSIWMRDNVKVNYRTDRVYGMVVCVSIELASFGAILVPLKPMQ